MKQYYGYVRVSTAKQGDGVSLEEQRYAIQTFSTRHDINISKWFEEKITAAKSGRPAFTQMLNELKRGKSTGVIFHKIDRSSRNFSDWAKLGELSEQGIDVRFANESLDFNSRGGRLAADVQMVFAADYIRNLRDETIKGINGRLRQGLYPFKAPLGYIDNGKGKPKTIDPVKGPLIRTLFEVYATGNYSLWSIVPEMERRGLTNALGNPLPKQSIEKILRNPFYAGIIEVGSFGKSFPGIHEPIVSVDLFQRVADIRSNRNIKKTTKHNHRYRGMIVCGECSRTLIPELQKGHVYYVARNGHARSKRLEKIA